tara:strand:- start:775 stop:882 length:108 start_codon:yes stop_codon:yes gene_type:complete
MRKIKEIWKRIKVKLSLYSQKFSAWLFSWQNGTKK